MKLEFTLDEIAVIAAQILTKYPDKRCFAFYAEMGSGKTTLINALCRQLGVTEHTSSPTFSIINEYRTDQDQVVYHADWYRLKGVQDAIEAGVQDILQHPTAYCFIEWPEIAEVLLPKECLRIHLSLVSADVRLLETHS